MDIVTKQQINMKLSKSHIERLNELKGVWGLSQAGLVERLLDEEWVRQRHNRMSDQKELLREARGFEVVSKDFGEFRMKENFAVMAEIDGANHILFVAAPDGVHDPEQACVRYIEIVRFDPRFYLNEHGFYQHVSKTTPYTLERWSRYHFAEFLVSAEDDENAPL